MDPEKDETPPPPTPFTDGGDDVLPPVPVARSESSEVSPSSQISEGPPPPSDVSSDKQPDEKISPSPVDQGGDKYVSLPESDDSAKKVSTTTDNKHDEVEVRPADTSIADKKVEPEVEVEETKQSPSSPKRSSVKPPDATELSVKSGQLLVSQELEDATMQLQESPVMRPSHGSAANLANVEELVTNLELNDSINRSNRHSRQQSNQNSGPGSVDGRHTPQLDHSCRYFIEMDELEWTPPPDDPNGAPEPVWVESARWRGGLEEDVEYDENGSEKFGQAHASGASMHGFFAFHQCLKKCIFLFELEADSLEEIANVVVDQLYEKKRIDEETKPKLIQAITAHHHHAMTAERHNELMAREKRRQKEREKRMAAVARNRRGSWVQGIKQITQKLKVSSAFNSANNSRAGSRANSKPQSPAGSQGTTPRGSRTPSLNEKEFGNVMGNGEMEMGKLETGANSDDEAEKLALQAMQKMGIDEEKGTGMKRNSSFGKIASLFGGGGGDGGEEGEERRERSESQKARRNSLTLVPTGEDEELTEVKDEAKVFLKGAGADDDEDEDNEAFDVMVGSCPFLDHQISAFVRLKNSDIIGELAEEGYRTRDLFICLGTEEQSDEAWQIGRSFAVLMSQEDFAMKIDSANSKERIIEIVDDFIDQSVIIPGQRNQQSHSERGGAGGNSGRATPGAESEGDSDHESDRESEHEANEPTGRPSNMRRRSSTTQLVEPLTMPKQRGFLAKALSFVGVTKIERATETALKVDMPQHIALQQRRRARIARERRAQLVKFQVDEEGDAAPVHQKWTGNDKRQIGGILAGALAIVLLLTTWVGPSLKDAHSGHHVHELHMHGFAGEVGGLISVDSAHPYSEYLVKGDSVAVFDLKLVAQIMAGSHRRVLTGGETTVDVKFLHDDGRGGAGAECFSFSTVKLKEDEEVEALEVFEPSYSSELCPMVSSDTAAEFFFQVSTNSNAPIGVIYQVDKLPGIAKYRTVLSAILLFFVYLCIVTDVVHRTLVAMVGAFCSLLLLATMDYHATMQTALIWMDEGTLALLFGMMIIVNLISTTGLFEWVAIRALERSGGHMSKLMVLLCIATAVLSAFLDNVTTMLLLAPVTIELCKVIEMNPIPFLISEVMFSNIGGTATMIGDPPNIIIGNMLSEYVGFVDFIVNLAPCIIVAAFPSLFFLKWYYKDEFDVPKKVFDIEALKKQYPITDTVLLAKSSIILGAVLLMFFLHPVHHVDTSWVACTGAIALMVIATPHELHHVFESVEWDTLLFFAALFVMIEAMATMGLIRSIGEGLSSIIAAAPEDDRLIVAIVVILWVSSIVSGFLDNIPYTATMVPVVRLLSENEDLNLPLKPLVWALSLGACLGGNMTLVGASANLVTAGTAEHEGHPITFKGFMAVGTPITFISVSVATVYCILVYEVMQVGAE